MDVNEQYEKDMEVWRKGVHKYETRHLVGWAIIIVQLALLLYLVYVDLTH